MASTHVTTWVLPVVRYGTGVTLVPDPCSCTGVCFNFQGPKQLKTPGLRLLTDLTSTGSVSSRLLTKTGTRLVPPASSGLSDCDHSLAGSQGLLPQLPNKIADFQFSVLL